MEKISLVLTVVSGQLSDSYLWGCDILSFELIRNRILVCCVLPYSLEIETNALPLHQTTSAQGLWSPRI